MSKTITLLAALCAMTTMRTIAQYCPGNDSINSPFDWKASGWYLYIKPNDNSPGQRQYLASPFHPNTPNTQPNTEHIEASAGAGDYKREDGWELLTEDMGIDSTKAVRFPQFVLYNSYESKLRYFVYLAGITNTNDIEIGIEFSSGLAGVRHVNAALEHAFVPTKVIEGYQYDSITIAIPNRGFYEHGVWAMADIPIAYDPCTCRYGSALMIYARTRQYSTLRFTLEGGGSIKQVIGQESGYSSNRVKNEGNRFANVAGGIKTGISQGVSAYRSAEALGSVAQQLLINRANKKLTPEVISTLSTLSGFSNLGSTGFTPLQVQTLSQLNNDNNTAPALKEAIGKVFSSGVPGSLVPSWLKNSVPFANTALALLDFIIAGGKNTSPMPLHFNAEFSFRGEGIIGNASNRTPITFYVPGSAIDSQKVEARRPKYNKIMGILNLMEQPVMHQAQQPEGEISPIPDAPEILFQSKSSLKLAAHCDTH